jgi:hypothetical protein
MGVNAFTQYGNTVAFTATTGSASTPVQAVSNGLGSSQYRIVVPAGTNTVYLGYGTTSAAASNNAVVLSAGSSSFTIPILPGTDEILTFAPNAYFSAITSAGSTLVFVTPGDGI